jgi:hypothetical protein
MARNILSLTSPPLLAAGGAALLLAQCSGVTPIGTNVEPDSGGDAPIGSSSGGSASGSSSGAGSSGSSSSGSGSGSGGSSSSGASSSSGGSDCCPSGYTLYACTYPDGGSGQACHNPALGCASSTTCGQGCDPVVSGTCGGSSSGGSSSSGGPTGLRWVRTCGPSLSQNGCFPDGGIHDDAGAPCPAIGSSCTTAGDLCGTPGPYSCPIGEQCATGDPVACPVSSRKFKEGVTYVDEQGLQQLHDQTLGIQLATYNYKAGVSDPAPRHLGFIIEDMPAATPAVGWSRDHVDLYGYVSMVVATMQVQEKEIADLRRELAATKAGCH